MIQNDKQPKQVAPPYTLNPTSSCMHRPTPDHTYHTSVEQVEVFGSHIAGTKYLRPFNPCAL